MMWGSDRDWLEIWANEGDSKSQFCASRLLCFFALTVYGGKEKNGENVRDV